MRQLRALLFDVDGTLAETEAHGHLVAFNRAFAELGLPWQWDVAEYAELLKIGGGKERLRHFLERQQDPATARGIDRLVAEIHRLKTSHYQRIVQRGDLPLRWGVRRLLEAAREQDVRLAIATTSSESSVLALLDAALGPRSADWFQCIAAGDVVVHKKPAPDVYRYALGCLGVEADEAVAFEDSQPGLESARGARLAVVVAPSEFTVRHDFSGAAAVLDHLGDPGRDCRQYAGCVELQPMVTLDGLKQLLEITNRSRSHGA